MIIILKQETKEHEIQTIIEGLESAYDVKARPIIGSTQKILGLVGDTSSIDESAVRAQHFVENLIRIQEPYKKANRLFHPENTTFQVAGQTIGGDQFSVIAGPCSIESPEQMETIAKAIKHSGAQFLRGGAFKPRTSPYSFQGLGDEGIELLCEAKRLTGLPIVSELMSADKLDLFVDNVDIIQIGARNMQNFSLLKEIGQTNKTILIKRGLSATIEELLMSAEYVLAGGNARVILCERGIRTFETATRNTLDISAIPILKKKSHLPVFVDPSHAAGMAWIVEPLSKAALAVGADGIMVEVHNDPEHAMCDGPQSMKPDTFDAMMVQLKNLAPFVGKKL